MPLKTERNCQNGWCENIFETTQKMSTYLVVLAIVDFGSLKTQTLVEGEKNITFGLKFHENFRYGYKFIR